MITGTSCVLIIKMVESAVALDIAVRCFMRRWPNAVFSLDEMELVSYSGISFGSLPDILIHENIEAKEDWDKNGLTDSNDCKLASLIVTHGELTVLIDSAATLRSVVDEIKQQVEGPLA